MEEAQALVQRSRRIRMKMESWISGVCTWSPPDPSTRTRMRRPDGIQIHLERGREDGGTDPTGLKRPSNKVGLCRRFGPPPFGTFGLGRYAKVSSDG
jgi:hypothetical protein